MKPKRKHPQLILSKTKVTERAEIKQNTIYFLVIFIAVLYFEIQKNSIKIFFFIFFFVFN